MERLERLGVLAKQVLSQLSYTPTAGTAIDVNAFAAVRKLRKLTSCSLEVHLQLETVFGASTSRASASPTSTRL